MFALPFPAIDPVAIEVGPIAIRWYALAYIAGIVLAWRYVLWLNSRRKPVMTRRDVDDLVVWITLGIILGGRLGYVLFYKPDYYVARPLEILSVWEGGMSFHGGLLGVMVAVVVFARRRGINLLSLWDLVACAAPIGLFLGRLANFVNGELYGRISDVPWAVVFPRGGPFPRHPSQLYEAALEGLLLFVVLFLLSRTAALRDRPGTLAGCFLAGYGLARFIVEFFREPDAFLGILVGGVTMGQLLSLPMLVAGISLIAFAASRRGIRDAPASGTSDRPQRVKTTMLLRVLVLGLLGMLLAVEAVFVGVALLLPGRPETNGPTTSGAGSIAVAAGETFDGKTETWAVEGHVIRPAAQVVELEWRVRYIDGRPAPQDLEVGLALDMLDHPMPPITPAIQTVAPGVYRAEAMIPMEGRWQARIALPGGTIQALLDIGQ